MVYLPMKSKGLDLIDKGYKIVGAYPNTKMPIGKGWQKKPLTREEVANAQSLVTSSTIGGPEKTVNRASDACSVSVLTEFTPAVDIDIYDRELAEAMHDFIYKIVGNVDGPVRYGLYPKRLLVFRADQTFKKFTSKGYEDSNGKLNRIEVLGKGQQFIAYGIHPESKKPYQWDVEPAPVDKLPLLTEELIRGIIEEFERLAESHTGLIKKTEGVAKEVRVEETKKKTPLNLHKDMVKEYLDKYRPANPDEYHTWLTVGMALHHQFSGLAQGLSFWDAWSKDNCSNYDDQEIISKYASFGNTDNVNAITFATIKYHVDQIENEKLKEQREAENEASIQQTEACREWINEAEDTDTLLTSVSSRIAELNLDALHLDVLANEIKRRIKELTGSAPQIKLIRQRLKNPLVVKSSLPDWAVNWAYLEVSDRFINLSTMTELTHKSFDMRFNRFLVQEGNKSASKFMSDQCDIDTYHDTFFHPDEGKIIEYHGERYVNAYADRTPKVSVKYTDDELAAVDAFQKHMEHLIAGEYERSLLLDFLCHQVQHVGKKIYWGLIIVGSEGDGKSFLDMVMKQTLGAEYVLSLNSDHLKEKYNGWAKNKLMICIEEMMISGTDKWRVANSIKPLVTNEYVSIREMKRDTYQRPNFCNILAFTNYWDAVPMTDTDRRWCVISTRFASGPSIVEFEKENPNYYPDLYDKVRAHPAAIRKFLLERKISEEFYKAKRAPVTKDTKNMRELSKSDNSQALDKFIQEDAMLLTLGVTTSQRIRNCFIEQGVEAPWTGQTLNRRLKQMKLNRLTMDGKEGKDRERFRVGGSLVTIYGGSEIILTEELLEEIKKLDKEEDSKANNILNLINMGSN